MNNNLKLTSVALLSLALVAAPVVSARSAKAVTANNTVNNTTNNATRNTSNNTTNSTTVTTSDDKAVEIDSDAETLGDAGITQFKKDTSDAKKIASLQKAGTNYIDSRIKLLTSLLTMVKNSTKLDATIKASMTADIQKEITDLTALKTQITAETDLTKLKTEVKNIFKSHHTYGAFAPKSRGMYAIGRLKSIIVRLTALETKIDKFLADLKTAGTDTTDADASYADYKLQIAAATTALDSAKTKLDAIKLTDLAGAKTALTEARALIKIARDAMNKARQDLDAIAATSASSGPLSNSTTNNATNNTTNNTTTNTTANSTL